MKRTRKENVEIKGEARIESTSTDHTIGKEVEKTFREEITDSTSQRRLAELSTTDTKTRTTEYRHDNVESQSRSEVDFTARTTHETNTTSVNEVLIERDTFRQEQVQEKMHSEQSVHEQIKAEEYEKSHGTRSSTVDEETDETVKGVNSSKITTDTLSTTQNSRQFENQTLTNTFSDISSTEHSDIENITEEKSRIKETQKKTSTDKTDSKLGDHTITKTDGTSTNDSNRTADGSSSTVDISSDKGTVNNNTIGHSEKGSLKDSATVSAGLHTKIIFPGFAIPSPSASAYGGTEGELTVSGDLKNENIGTSSDNTRKNANTTNAKSHDTDITVSHETSDNDVKTKREEEIKAENTSDTTTKSTRNAKIKTVE
ncbi:hypothetical protein BDR26DRAFT_907105 [Obelidium mucronatum]|nr:hypothetical protein BDR26DRAFT_907105 [Obelidium mucronatum]